MDVSIIINVINAKLILAIIIAIEIIHVNIFFVKYANINIKMNNVNNKIYVKIVNNSLNIHINYIIVLNKINVPNKKFFVIIVNLFIMFNGVLIIINVYHVII
jgi:hypothetical protein